MGLEKHCTSLLVLDTETTGLSFTDDEIIEFAAAKLEWRGGGWLTILEADEFICTTNDRKLPPKIVELTGITDELLAQKGVSKQAICALLAQLFTPGTMIVTYNAQFDLLFLYHLLARHGDARLLRDKSKLDLLTVYRDRRAYPHRLSNAIEAYGLQDSVKNTHRAIDDVRATVALMKAMQQERDDLAQYINLFGYSAKYGISGQKIASVRYAPQGYTPADPLYKILADEKK